MATYLLLRNNKESGPYTLAELEAKGLKPYDLVWVEGKSAAWRYPSEVEELKRFAPIVEEQPYDRFFKKPSDKPAQESVTTSFAEADKSKAAPAQQAVVLNLDNRNVYVTMPAGQSFVAARENAKPKETPVKEFVQKTYQPATTPTRAEEPPKKVNEPTYEKFESNRGSGIENNPAERTIPVARHRGNPGRYRSPVLIGSGVLLLLAMGIFIGMQIADRGTKSTKPALQAGQTVADKQQPATATHPQNAVHPENIEKNDHFLDSVATIVASQNRALAAKKKADTDAKKLQSQNARIADSINALQQKAPADSSGFTVTHRESTHRDDAAGDKNTSKINLADFVSISTNKYTVGTFGGISDLQLSVKNQSTYPLDLAVVEVQYIQANKKIFKTENLYFHNVAPGSVLMQEAPKSPRGIKVQYRLTLVNSKQSGLSYSGI